MCTINDVSVTIPGAVSMHFSCNIYTYTIRVLKHLFSISAISICLPLRCNDCSDFPFTAIPRGKFIGSRCVFKCKTVNKKKITHTLQYLTRDILYIDYHRTETLHWCYICFVYPIVYFRVFYKSERTNQTRLSDTVNVRERKKKPCEHKQWYEINDVIVERYSLHRVQYSFVWTFHGKCYTIRYCHICLCSELHATYCWYFNWIYEQIHINSLSIHLFYADCIQYDSTHSLKCKWICNAQEFGCDRWNVCHFNLS